MSEQKSFFSTLPGILTALAGLVTAVAGLILALSQTGLIGSRGKEETKPVAVPPSQPEPAPPKQPLALPPKKSVATAPAQPVRKAPETPQEPTALLETPKLTPQPVTRTPATDGWAIIGFYEQGKFSDLTLMVRGERPVAGQSYEAVKDFRLVLKQRPEKGEKVITLGMVHRGDSVEVLDIEIAPSTRKVPVSAKLRAVLHPIERPQEPTARLETPKPTPQPVTPTPTTDGWAIIGFYERGTFSDLVLMVGGERPVAGRSYEAVKDFRLVLKQRPEKGEKVITLGMVHRGDSVEVVDLEIEPGYSKVPVWAKLRAVLYPIDRSSR